MFTSLKSVQSPFLSLPRFWNPFYHLAFEGFDAWFYVLGSSLGIFLSLKVSRLGCAASSSSSFSNWGFFFQPILAFVKGNWFREDFCWRLSFLDTLVFSIDWFYSLLSAIVSACFHRDHLPFPLPISPEFWKKKKVPASTGWCWLDALFFFFNTPHKFSFTSSQKHGFFPREFYKFKFQGKPSNKMSWVIRWMYNWWRSFRNHKFSLTLQKLIPQYINIILS